MVDSEGVLEAGVTSAGIDQMDEAELGDVAKTLKILGVYKGEKRLREVDVSPNRIADRLAFFFQQRMVHVGPIYLCGIALSRRLTGAHGWD